MRALQENRISRVGSDKDIQVDVRVIAATNKDLSKEIGQGSFREDLYHRLSVIIIKVPSLNERTEDIPLLLDHFNEMICEELGVKKKEFETDAVKELQKLTWTGNIREFRNVVERLIILSDTKITKKDVASFVTPLNPN